MKPDRYTWPAVILHWLMAGLILWLFWLGWTMTDLPKGVERTAAYGLHKSFGLLVLLLAGLRLGYRFWQGAPAPLGSGWQQRLAGAVHRLLYAFMLLAPLAGYLTSSFTPYAVKFFGIELPRTGWPDEGLNALFKQAHLLFLCLGGGLIALHLAGAVRHALQAGKETVQ